MVIITKKLNGNPRDKISISGGGGGGGLRNALLVQAEVSPMVSSSTSPRA